MKAIFIRHGESTGNAGMPCHDLATIEATNRRARLPRACPKPTPQYHVTYTRTRQSAALLNAFPRRAGRDVAHRREVYNNPAMQRWTTQFTSSRCLPQYCLPEQSTERRRVGQACTGTERNGVAPDHSN